eukprot:Gb_41787 [translate_table: standard]
MSSFFDKDWESLPKGREFSSLIFENARNCKVAILVLSDEFLTSKWPMLELEMIVEAKNFTNTDVAILPLFYNISVGTLRQKLGNKFKGKVFHVEFGRENFVKMQKQVLKVLTGAGDGLLNLVFTKE